MAPIKPEVLSPAGSPEALRAAISSGADAVYFGVGDYNARIRARNFELGDLPEVLRDLRRWGVKSYLAFNTLIFLEERTAARAALSRIIAAGPDGIIVQDLGVAGWIREMAPGLPIHGSTQMTAASGPAVRLLERLGVSRVILARELTLPEIARIRRETEMELEVFVHGALCVSYSGQCLSSEAFGGRSANRGQCAQACRLPYALMVDGTHKDMGDRVYLLSPKDLEAHKRIPDLVRLGVAGFKIEGRMKSPEYVASATALYRSAVDRAWAAIYPAPDPADAPPEDRLPWDQSPEVADLPTLSREAEQIFSRGGCEGFLGGINHQKLVDGRTRSHRGLFLGTVAELEKEGDGRIRTVILRTGQVALAEALRPGDGILLAPSALEEDEVGGRLLSAEPASTPGRFRLRFPRASMPDLKKARPGTPVYRTADPRLLERLRERIRHPEKHRSVPLKATVQGSPGDFLRLRLTDPEGRTAESASSLPLLSAESRALDRQRLVDQLGRLGGTRYRLASLSIYLDPGLFLPVSELNGLRRKAVALLDDLRLRPRLPAAAVGAPGARPVESDNLPSPVLWAVDQAEGERSAPPATSAVSPLSSVTAVTGAFPEQLLVLCRNRRQTEGALKAGARRIILDFLDLEGLKETARELRSAGIRTTLALPRVQKPGEERIEPFFLGLEPEAILARNLGSLERLDELRRTAKDRAGSAPPPPFPAVIGDVSLNAVNPEAVAALMDLSCDRVTPGLDLNGDQLLRLVRAVDPRTLEIPLHHHLPIFHTEHCVFAACLSEGADYRTCGRPCDRHRIALRDRTGQAHPVVADVGCRNTVFGARAQSCLPEAEALRDAGVAHFRIELQAHGRKDTGRVLEIYRHVWDGALSWKNALRELEAEGRYGVSTGAPEPPRRMETKPVGGKRAAPRAQRYSKPRSSSSSSLRPK